MLGPALFIIYISNIDANVSSSVIKFADDTKLCSNDCICDKTRKWQMLFNADKCMRLHVGHSHPSVNCSIGGVEIRNVKAEKDLGVTIGCAIDSSLQCA